MKHRIFMLLLTASNVLYAGNNKHIILEKDQRIGRFSTEDSFDAKQANAILNKASDEVKKIVLSLLYPPKNSEAVPERLLLLGNAISNASKVALAKAIAVRCGYDYYVIEASLLATEYQNGRQALLREIYPILERDKPTVIIVTEFAELLDYSGLLASTLWLLLHKCAPYPHIFFIGTSNFQEKNLSIQVRDKFNGDIVTAMFNKPVHKAIMSLHGQGQHNRITFATLGYIAAGGVCFVLGAGYVIGSLYYAMMQDAREEELLAQKKNKLSMQELLTKEHLDLQKQKILLRQQRHGSEKDMQQQQLSLQQKQYDLEQDRLKHQKETAEEEQKQKERKLKMMANAIDVQMVNDLLQASKSAETKATRTMQYWMANTGDVTPEKLIAIYRNFQEKRTNILNKGE